MNAKSRSHQRAPTNFRPHPWQMLIEEDHISGDYPVLIKLPSGDQKLVRLRIGAQTVPEIRIGKIRIPSMLSLRISYPYSLRSESFAWSEVRIDLLSYRNEQGLGSNPEK